MKGYQLLALLLVGSLFALTGLRQFFVQPLATPLSNVLWFTAQVLPLLAVLPGILQISARGFLYAIFAAMLYFIHGVMEAATPELRALALWEIAFATAMVAVGALAMRRLNRQSPSQ